MNKIKVIFQQMVMITSGIFVVIAISGVVSHVRGEVFYLEWYQPLSVLVSGFFCAVPTLMWLTGEELTKKQFIARLVFHCLLLFGIISLIGYLFRWYTTPGGYLVVAAAYFIIYIFVWLATGWLDKQDEAKINSALKDIQDEE